MILLLLSHEEAEVLASRCQGVPELRAKIRRACDGDVFADFDGEHRDVWLTDYGNGYEVVAASFHDADVATKFFDRWWAQMNAEALRDQGMLASASASATRKRKA
jgi:hypothetical protein